MGVKWPNYSILCAGRRCACKGPHVWHAWSTGHLVFALLLKDPNFTYLSLLHVQILSQTFLVNGCFRINEGVWILKVYYNISKHISVKISKNSIYNSSRYLTTPNSLNELANGTPITIKHYVFSDIFMTEHCDGLMKRPKHVARFGQ